MLDIRSDRITRKSAEARDKAIPAFCTVGAREMKEGTLALRPRESTVEVMAIDAVIARLTSARANASQRQSASLDNFAAACDSHACGSSEGAAS